MDRSTIGVTGFTAGLFAGVAAGVAVGRALNPETKSPQPAKPVDAERLFRGRWAELGRTPSLLTDGCVAGAANYDLVSPTEIAVRDTCQAGSPTGKERAMAGMGTILDPGVNAKYRVRYRLFGFVPVTLEFWVLDRDEDYAWFIAADPPFRNLWIFARDPRLDAGALNGLINRARAIGYDTSKLEFPAQGSGRGTETRPD